MIDNFFAALNRAGIEGAIAGVTAAAEMIANSAKTKAPVRKVFAGQESQVRYRLKSIEEIHGDRGLRHALGLGPENDWVHPPRTVTRDAPRMFSLREVIPGTHILARRGAAERLSRRGRYELRSGRSIHKDQLGGRLRDEIHSTEARQEGNLVVADVVSPTPYAKYMEFGTRHNAAHPFLRPAFHESAQEAMGMIAREVAQAARGSGGRAQFKLKWRLKGGAR